MIIACILEFVIGNTFSGVAFGTYGTDRSSCRRLTWLTTEQAASGLLRQLPLPHSTVSSNTLIRKILRIPDSMAHSVCHRLV